MKIIVRSDDGKREASFTLQTPEGKTEKETAEMLCSCLGDLFEESLRDSITVTDVPSEPEPEFKFKVGDRVHIIANGRSGDYTVWKRGTKADGSAFYCLQWKNEVGGGVEFYDHELEPAP
jgi:hypothetical protein